MMTTLRTVALGLLLFTVTVLSCGQATGQSKQNGKTDKDARSGATYILVRHAEKGSGGDPELTGEGKDRAERLAGRLRAENIVAVYSTNTNRTMATAAPTATDHGLDIITYDAGDAATFAGTLKTKHAGGAILIVGHSNTVPDLVNALAGTDEYRDIDEEDYGNLYTVTTGKRGKGKAKVNRY